MTQRARRFDEISGEFVRYVTDIKYATMTTVDAKGRPRARVLLPIWELTEAGPVGWLAAYRTPVKVAHLADNPHTTFSYWDPKQNSVFVDATAAWVEDAEEKARVWRLYRTGSPPGVGYDPIAYWRGGPADPEYGLLRIDPWRVQVLRGSDLRSILWYA
ncbi:pyridoxamine 5'-phosphate oxidase family protein [Pseudonocardia eucalypti]|uniref:Pyridoxamine 5'-phosphate oxidase family protein n=1 Tax=Pseudonocardia eucalypti TaxID=648755 RepID=A0ABP9QBD5_9PSEU|nr:general stress protein 26 [Pseudonocardia eucalypti]